MSQVADHQSQWENYLAKHSIEALYREMTTALLDTQPENPKKFLFEYMKKNFAPELDLEASHPQAANADELAAPPAPAP